jgi:hypothetical protein
VCLPAHESQFSNCHVLIDTTSRSHSSICPKFARNFLTPRREYRAHDAPAASCAKIKSTRVSHHGHTGDTRHSPRNGFNAYNALSPVSGLASHRRRRNCFRRLDPDVARSGPHALAVRITRRSLSAHPRQSHPVPSRPAFRDDREPPPSEISEIQKLIKMPFSGSCISTRAARRWVSRRARQ